MPLGGALAIAASSSIALLCAAGVMLLAVLALVLAGFREATVEQDQLTDDEARA